MPALTFRDLRETAATALAEAGATDREIAAVTDHSPKTMTRMLIRHHAKATSKAAANAIAKLAPAVLALPAAAPADRWQDITPAELQTLVDRLPLTKTGAEFGVSDVAVRKKCQKFGTALPPRSGRRTHTVR